MPNDGVQAAEKLVDVANDAARAVNTRFVTFLTVGIYIAVTIASTTDEMLVRASPVTLPLLNSPIPISGLFGFYTVVPWLVVLLHWDLLLQLSTLRSKLSRFREIVEPLPEDQRTLLRDRVASFYYVQSFLHGASPFLNRLAALITWAAVVVVPLLLLAIMQGRFVRYHSISVTRLHQLAGVVDVLLVLALWPRLSVSDDRLIGQAATWRAGMRTLVPLPTATVCGVCLVFSLAIATIPGELSRPSGDTADPPETGFWSQIQSEWFSARNLNLRESVLTENKLAADIINDLDQGNVAQRENALRNVSSLNFLQGRDLRYANLYHAILPKLDLRSPRSGNELSTRTQLRAADLSWAQMQQVLLDDADLRDAKLDGAQLQGASLSSAELQNAAISDARMQDANLEHANLQHAQMLRTQLQGAHLASAHLQEANLSGAHLQAANLQNADLEGTDLSDADLEGADLTGAHLERAILRGARLKGASWRGSFVWGADFGDADLDLPESLPTMQPKAFEGAKLGCCSKEQGAVFKCAALEAEPYVEALGEFLLKLACADAYVARGLAARALYDTVDPDRRHLAEVLITHTQPDVNKSGPVCPGIALLPPAVKDKLEQFTEQTLPPATPRIEEAKRQVCRVDSGRVVIGETRSRMSVGDGSGLNP